MAYDADECTQALPVVDVLTRASLRESLACEASKSEVTSSVTELANSIAISTQRRRRCFSSPSFVIALF